MKVMWCWRCEQEVPMLDEDEYAEVAKLVQDCMTDPKPPAAKVSDVFRPIVEAYQRLTGAVGYHHNAIMHHRIQLYGRPCPQCGKPLRTPSATYCAACGHRREGH